MKKEPLSEAERNKTLLTELINGLSGLRRLPPDYSSELDELKEALEERLRKLRTALTSFYDLRARDELDNPIHQSDYLVHFGRIEEVGTYCTTDLLQKLEQVRDRLGELDDKKPAAIVDNLIRKVTGKPPQPVDERQSQSQEAAWSLSEDRDAYQNTREREEVDRHDLAVVVSPVLLERLRVYQMQLGEYIQGYISCQRFSADVLEVYSQFDNARKRELNGDDWNHVRKFVNDIFAAVDDLGSYFEGDAELKQLLTSLQDLVSKAREQLRSARATNETAEVMAGHLYDMRYPLEDFNRKCPTRANAKLGELRDVINQIQGQMERQRDAHYRTRERAVEAGDTSRIWRKPRLTSDSTIEREQREPKNYG